MVGKLSTGTTCIGVTFKDGVLLAADRRTTAGYVASDKSTKVYDLSSNVVATTAGHAADNQRLMRSLKGELKLLELKSERVSTVKEAAMIINSAQYTGLRAQGSIMSILLGGFDKYGASLYNLGPDGTIVAHDGYAADGSGSVYVKGILDVEYKENLSKKEALEIVEKCFRASFKNDTASGGGFIIKFVTKDGIEEISRKVIESKFVDEK